MRLKKILVFSWLFMLIAVVAAIFWYNELQYQLPTPTPVGYHPVERGALVNLPQDFVGNTKKPVFIHFFNPDCPCSKFNVPKFKELVAAYGEKIDFKIVVLANDQYTPNDIREKFKLNIPVFFDKAIADSCGVYSTPQIALLDQDHRLYYRGNYNRTRYCTDKKTDYASMAINGLIQKEPLLKFDKMALVSYGCTLPNCEK